MGKKIIYKALSKKFTDFNDYCDYVERNYSSSHPVVQRIKKLGRKQAEVETLILRFKSDSQNEEQIRRNLEIIKRTAHSKYRRDHVRFHLSVYRLSHVLNIPLEVICRLTFLIGVNCTKKYLQHVIGIVFTYLCNKDESYLLKNLLQTERKRM